MRTQLHKWLFYWMRIRVFMTQDQNVVRSTEALGHLLHIELFCHLMDPSFPQRWIYSSVSAG